MRLPRLGSTLVTISDLSFRVRPISDKGFDYLEVFHDSKMVASLSVGTVPEMMQHFLSDPNLYIFSGVRVVESHGSVNGVTEYRADRTAIAA